MSFLFWGYKIIPIHLQTHSSCHFSNYYYLPKHHWFWPTCPKWSHTEYSCTLMGFENIFCCCCYFVFKLILEVMALSLSRKKTDQGSWKRGRTHPRTQLVSSVPHLTLHISQPPFLGVYNRALGRAEDFASFGGDFCACTFLSNEVFLLFISFANISEEKSQLI